MDWNFCVLSDMSETQTVGAIDHGGASNMRRDPSMTSHQKCGKHGVERG